MRTSIPTIFVLAILFYWRCTPPASTPKTFACSDSTKQLILDQASSFNEMEELSEEILQQYFKQLQVWEACGDPYVDSTLAKLNDDLGRIFHSEWELKKARRLFKEAINISNTLIGEVL